MARLFIVLGIISLLLGVLWHFGFRIGSLPGDIHFTKGQTQVSIPITSCVLLSVLFSALMWAFRSARGP